MLGLGYRLRVQIPWLAMQGGGALTLDPGVPKPNPHRSTIQHSMTDLSISPQAPPSGLGLSPQDQPPAHSPAMASDVANSACRASHVRGARELRMATLRVAWLLAEVGRTMHWLTGM